MIACQEWESLTALNGTRFLLLGCVHLQLAREEWLKKRGHSPVPWRSQAIKTFLCHQLSCAQLGRMSQKQSRPNCWSSTVRQQLQGWGEFLGMRALTPSLPNHPHQGCSAPPQT